MPLCPELIFPSKCSPLESRPEKFRIQLKHCTTQRSWTAISFHEDYCSEKWAALATNASNDKALDMMNCCIISFLSQALCSFISSLSAAICSLISALSLMRHCSSTMSPANIIIPPNIIRESCLSCNSSCFSWKATDAFS